MQNTMNGRQLARQLTMQALYQWQLAHSNLSDLLSQFAEDEDFASADCEYFNHLVREILSHTQTLDQAIEPFLDRPIQLIDPIERAILWLGAYELTQRTDLPYKVVINEAVELAKRFGAEGGHRYVNGVLDKLARTVRMEYKKD